jgi:hypothetical protein
MQTELYLECRRKKEVSLIFLSITVSYLIGKVFAMLNAMKAYGGVDVYIHIFLTSALAVGELSASHPGCFTRGERTPGTHWIGGWVDPRAGLDNVEKRKFLTLPGLELRLLSLPARSESLYRLRYQSVGMFIFPNVIPCCRSCGLFAFKDYGEVLSLCRHWDYWIPAFRENSPQSKTGVLKMRTSLKPSQNLNGL